MTIHHGDCIQVMRDMPEASIDAIVTDPPYGLGFMGKAWDDLPPGEEWARECLRVLKPGGHMLAFGGTRTWHRLAVAVEDAGFEIRDSIAWLYGSGFPKSLDVGKAIDKAAGATREVVGLRTYGDGQTYQGGDAAGRSAGHMGNVVARQPSYETVPATDAARKWQGWGTALKPAHEPIIVARKPLVGTVAANVMAHGTGALNIDGCRIEYEQGGSLASNPSLRTHINGGNGGHIISTETERRVVTPNAAGRWPANVALDDSQAAALDEQSGTSKSRASAGRQTAKNGTAALGDFAGNVKNVAGHDVQGGASRFMYVAKAGANERPKVNGIAHATVKPLTLMRWLVRLVTPPGGTVLDPFAGSGTTLEAAMLEGFSVIGIEREAEYMPLINMRVARAKETPPPVEPPTLFGDAS